VADGALAITVTLACSAAAVLAAIILGYLMARSIVNPLNEAVRVAENVAAGDLSTRIEAHSRDETGQLMLALRKMNDNLVDIVGGVRRGTDSITTASGEIASGNLDLSSRTEQQAGSLEETASAMEEMTSTVRQNADNARQANQLAASASQIAKQGGEIVGRVVDTMEEINQSSRKIVDIIGVIDGIAFQTNILALNAAVEAARGEQGRGFAVVAPKCAAGPALGRGGQGSRRSSMTRSARSRGSALVAEAGNTMQQVVSSVRSDRHRRRDLGGQRRAEHRHRGNQPRRQPDGRKHPAKRRPGGTGRSRGCGRACESRLQGWRRHQHLQAGARRERSAGRAGQAGQRQQRCVQRRWSSLRSQRLAGERGTGHGGTGQQGRGPRR
jgi:HAMP domain-containing protein